MRVQPSVDDSVQLSLVILSGNATTLGQPPTSSNMTMPILFLSSSQESKQVVRLNPQVWNGR